ncbi:MAG: DUF1684 domain-containing protein [Actinomycetota bacterium]|nr:DUF1684 domain-containing protein [Actinomycetota bacterium]
MTTHDLPSLWDYRSRVAEQYRRVRMTGADESSWRRWRTDRDHLFSTHAQSPIETDSRHEGGEVPFFPYDPVWRIEVEIAPIESTPLSAGHSSGGETSLIRFATVAFPMPYGTEAVELSLFWIDAYGGGVFVPFRDGTNGDGTYGGGRYLLDTAKGADLGSNGGLVMLDFNFAYHPSCVYSDRWSCPLAPPENRLTLEVNAGERLP